MKLNSDDLKAIAAMVYSTERKNRRHLYYEMFQLYEGNGKEIIKQRIRSEFTDQTAIMELESRLVNINFTKKVINKLAGVYIEAPVRAVVDQNSEDEDLLERVEDVMSIDYIQKEENRNMEIYKKNLKEFFTRKGKPAARNHPAHTYEVFAYNTSDKNEVTVVVKIIIDSAQSSEAILYVYTDEQFIIIDGDGVPVKALMDAKGIYNDQNEIGSLPFEYSTKCTYGLDPIPDDDLHAFHIVMCIIMTDLLFACKYQCWSLIYTIGLKGDIRMNPNSVTQLEQTTAEEKPQIGQIKPQVDIAEVMGMLKDFTAMFLSSRGLQAGTVNMSGPRDVASGISKMIDSADNIENKTDQQDYMLKSENSLWVILSHVMIPFWRLANLLESDFNKEFSQAFRVSVSFKQPRIMLSEKDQVDLSASKIEKNFSTLKIELKNLNPDFTDDQIDELYQSIMDFQAEKAKFFQLMMPKAVPGASNNGQVQPNIQNKPN